MLLPRRGFWRRRMVCFEIFGMRLALDFTAPALFALLSMYLPRAALLQTVSACLLHECAHLLLIAICGERPALLRISAAGLRLEAFGTALMPLHRFAAILLAGPAANLLAAAAFWDCGMRDAAAANLSLCCFNLLPFRSTDGGTLLFAWLEKLLLTRAPELPRRILRGCGIATAALILGILLPNHRNISLCGMTIFMLIAEFADN